MKSFGINYVLIIGLGCLTMTAQAFETCDGAKNKEQCERVLNSAKNGGTKIDLSNMGIKKVEKEDFEGMSHVKEFILGAEIELGESTEKRKNMAIKKLPQGLFEQMPQLELIQVEHTSIKADSFYSGMFEMQADTLKNLYIGANKLVVELPCDVFANLAKLKELKIHRMNLAKLCPNQFKGLHSLYYLDIGHNDLNEFPKGLIDDLTTMVKFEADSNAEDTAGLVTLPEGFFDYNAKLEELDLDQNGLRWLPEGIFKNLGKLDFLDISCNKDLKLKKNTHGISKDVYIKNDKQC